MLQPACTSQHISVIMSSDDPRPGLAPQELKEIVRAVFGYYDQPPAEPDPRIEEQTTDTALKPAQITALFGFPDAGDQTEQCIGVVELAGGCRPADVAKHFRALEVSPGLKAVAVDHSGQRSTGDPNDLDDEMMLDIDVVSAIASAHIVIYFAPNTDHGCLVAWRRPGAPK